MIVMVCTILLFPNAYGQVFKNFTEVNGVPLSSTLGITQDKQGFMWFGTEGGLYRYDGKTFTPYRTGNDHNPKYIREMTTDSRGNIWIASTRSGLHRYEPDKHIFTNFEHDSANANSLSHTSVNCVMIDRKNQIWAGTQDGVSRITEDRGKFRIKRYLQKDFSGQTLQIRSLAEDKAGNIWVATGDGLLKMRNDGSQARLYRIPSQKTQIDLSQIIFVYVDDSGTIWLGSNGTGLYQFDPVAEKFSLIETFKAPNGEFPRVSKMVPDGKGKYWMATTLGLVHFDPRTLRADWYVNRPGDSNSLGNTVLFSVYLDRQGGVWCGSFYAGISYLHSDSPQFTSWPFAVTDVRSRSFTNAWLGKGKAKHIWAVSDNLDQLLVFDTNGNNPSSFALKLAKEADYYGIFLDENDVFWAAGNSILTSLNLRTGSYQHYPITAEGETWLANARTFAIFTDSRGRFWIGGYYGLLMFDQKRGKFIRQTPVNISVRSFYEDSKQNIWIGCANEVYRVNAKDSTAAAPPLEKISVGPETTNYFWKITEDPSGTIWAAGTNFLFQYNAKKNRFEPNADVPGGFIKDVVPDGQGYLWLNATHKLLRYHPKNRTLQSYGYGDGLPQNGLIMQGSGTTDARGNIYFLTNQGMFSFDPAAISVNEDTNPLMLTSLKLYNKEVATGDSTGLLPEPLWKTRAITFRHDQSIFTIEFALLDYVRSGQNKYAYKIDGVDHDWNYVENPSATYTNLPSGTYTFQVKAANGDGVWMREPVELQITILPPWWKTWYAYLFYLLVTAAVVYGVTRFLWIRSSFRRETALNQVKLDFFTNVSHEIRTHLSLISGPLEKAHKQWQEGEDVEHNLNYARASSDRLMLLVNELLDFRKIQSGGVRLQVREHDVVKIMKRIIAAFEHISREKEVETSLVCPDTPVMLWFDIAQMQKVFYNLLSNAYKFTPSGGRVSVRITELSNEVNIVVEDTGKGISPDHLRKLFTYYYQADSEKPGYGIGLALSKSIVEQHRGYLTAESRLTTDTGSGGTTLSVRLLRDNRHFSRDEIAIKGSDYVAGVFAGPAAAAVMNDAVADTQRNTILVIEDNDELRAFISELFEGEFNTLTAENGLRGLELARAHIPDVIVSDVMMPEMNGLELCRRVKSDIATAHIPVILLTARTHSEQIIEGLEVGADDYLMKPFDPRVITLKINNLLRLRDDMKERYRQSVLVEREAGNAVAQDMNDAFIGKLRVLTTEHISDPDFGVSELAVQAGMSVSVLYRKLRSITGMTINEFIKTIRLAEAKKLLESGVYQVGEVATFIGFEDSKYFSKEFRKAFGKNPAEFKKMESFKKT
ncbi:hybrid sensor histidine kinase/response regulator [Dyadobacter beijingensis]|uniref:histidine kinase n=2 Tax=Dyadobacter beijingensis TaxID=365489 RepID=A0ABQ2HNI7_9BACT|nr:hybrid sensor histidine kinase/response regulator [Dyadobacter beijingensis]